MADRTVVVAGGTGFVGRALIHHLAKAGYLVVVLTRRRTVPQLPAGAVPVTWDAGQGTSQERSGHGSLPWHEVVTKADAVVNLAGEPIAARRWSPRQKERILHSRVAATRALAEAALRAQPTRPAVWVNASAVGYYGRRPSSPVDETSPPGDDFLARVCVAWEAATAPAEEAGIRVVRLRLGLVLGPGGGLLSRVAWPYRLGLGAIPGDGSQPFPWVHVEDVARLTAWALTEGDARGPYNVTAPEAHTMASFCRELAQVLGRPCRWRVPGVLIRLALGEMADLVLGGQQAEPRRALSAGFAFRYPTLRPALEDALRPPEASSGRCLFPLR